MRSPHGQAAEDGILIHAVCTWHPRERDGLWFLLLHCAAVVDLDALGASRDSSTRARRLRVQTHARLGGGTRLESEMDGWGRRQSGRSGVTH